MTMTRAVPKTITTAMMMMIIIIIIAIIIIIIIIIIINTDKPMTNLYGSDAA